MTGHKGVVHASFLGIFVKTISFYPTVSSKLGVAQNACTPISWSTYGLPNTSKCYTWSGFTFLPSCVPEGPNVWYMYMDSVCVCVFAFRNALFLREIFRLHINLSMKTNYHVFLAIDQPSTGPDSSRIIQMHRIHKQTMSFKHLGPPNDLFVLQISLTQ